MRLAERGHRGRIRLSPVCPRSVLPGTTNYTAPDAITPNSNNNLQTGGTYSSWLAPASVTMPNNDTASVSYDTYGRPSSGTTIYGASLSWTYPFPGNLPYTITKVTNGTSNGHWETTTLDGLGRPVQVDRGYYTNSTSTTVSSIQTVYGSCACSPLGKVKQVSQPYAPGGTVYWTTYNYDGLGRTVSVVVPDGASTTTYAFSGNVTTITDPAGKWKKQTADAMGNLKQVNEPNPAGGSDYVTTYTYDMLNHLTQVSMTRGTTTQTRTFNYGSPPGVHLLSETHPESGTTTYTYNTDNTLATKVDAKAQKTAYSYDTYQRVTMIQRYPNGTTEDTCQRMTITYDTATNGWGRPASHAWGGSTCTNLGGRSFSQTYAYTPAGLVTQKNLYGLTATYAYNNEGRVSSTTYPGGTSDPGKTYTYTFDGMGRPITVTDNQTTPVTWAKNVVYNAAYQITSIDRVTSTAGPQYETETMQYNSLLQLTRQTISGSFYNFDMQYNFSGTQNNGRILSTHDYGTAEVVSYSYDTLNRLSGATGSGWGETFTYDGFGNLTDKTVTSGSAPPLHVTVNGATNQISSYTYDLNGNLTQPPGTTSATYDVDNRMVTARPTSGGTEYYGYGPDNMRMYKKKPDGSEELYFFGVYGERLGTFTPSTLATVNRTVYFGTRMIWSRQLTGQNIWAATTVQDRLGSVRLFPTSPTPYYPYGEEYSTTVPDREKYATYFRDGTTALDYARNRYYSSTLGRFLTADPYRNSAGPGDPGSWNRYAYVLNDPVNLYDPMGLDACLGDGEDQYRFGGTACSVLGNGVVMPQRGKSDSDRQRGGGPGGDSTAQLLAQALTAALNALHSRSCSGIFNTDPRKPHTYDAATVLQAIVTGVPLSGVFFGRVTESRMQLDLAAVTAPGPDAVTIGSGAVASTANIILQDSPLSPNNYHDETPVEVASTLLHELGHVFNIVTSLGGSKILNDVNPDGTTNAAAEAANAKTLEKCKPSLP